MNTSKSTQTGLFLKVLLLFLFFGALGLAGGGILKIQFLNRPLEDLNDEAENLKESINYAQNQIKQQPNKREIQRLRSSLDIEKKRLNKTLTEEEGTLRASTIEPLEFSDFERSTSSLAIGMEKSGLRIKRMVKSTVTKQESKAPLRAIHSDGDFEHVYEALLLASDLQDLLIHSIEIAQDGETGFLTFLLNYTFARSLAPEQ